MNIIITGSSRGIGFGLADYFLKGNHKVIINGTTEESVNKALSYLESKYNENVKAFVGKVNVYEDMDNLYKYGQKELGNIDIWINNAGINQEDLLFKDISMDNVRKVIDTNLIGAMNGSQVAIRNMMKQGYGHIYNMEGYGSNDMMSPKMTIYGTSKRALTYFTKALAKELKETPLCASLLSPGMVLTDFLLKGLPENKEEAKKLLDVYNILADKPEVVTEYLGQEILKNKKNGSHIKWLTNSKVAWRFATAKVLKRNVV